MKLWLKRLAILAALGAVIALLRFFFPGNEAEIRRTLNRAARLASFEGNEGSLGRLSQAAELASLCTSDVVVRLDWLGGVYGGLDGRDAVRNAAISAANFATRFQIRALDIEFRSIDPPNARVRMALSADGDAAPSREINAQEFECTLRKVGRKWRIARVETVKTLQR